MKNWLKNNYVIFIVIILAITLFFIYSYLSIYNGKHFYTPDETANFFFINTYSQNFLLSVAEPLNELAGNIIHPRSVNIINNKLVPGSFLGLIVIYGLFAKIFSISITMYLSAFLAVVNLFIFYLLITKIFASRKIAVWSAIFLSLTAPYWYAVSRAFFQESLYLFLLLFGLFLLVYAPKNKYFYFLSAISLGLSVFVRTTNALIVVTLFILYFLFFKNQRKLLNLLMVMTGLIICSIVFFYFNWQTYESFFSTGYFYLQESPTLKNQTFSLLTNMVLPFGFSLSKVAFNTINYFIKFNWLISIFGLLSIIHLIFNKKINTTLLNFYCSFTLTTIILQILYYGAFWPWGLSGLPAIPQINIGAVHLRYWLLSIVLLIPLSIYFFQEIFPKILGIKNKNIFLIIIFIVFGCFSYSTVFNDPQQGLKKIKLDIADYQIRLNEIAKYLPENSIIVTDEWADRIFFPKYKIIYSATDKKTHGRLIFGDISRLLKEQPIFLYGSINYEERDKLDMYFFQYNLQLNEIAVIFKDEKLFEIISLKNE